MKRTFMIYFYHLQTARVSRRFRKLCRIQVDYIDNK